jgi:hypothetical protein
MAKNDHPEIPPGTISLGWLKWEVSTPPGFPYWEVVKDYPGVRYLKHYVRTVLRFTHLRDGIHEICRIVETILDCDEEDVWRMPVTEVAEVLRKSVAPAQTQKRRRKRSDNDERDEYIARRWEDDKAKWAEIMGEVKANRAWNSLETIPAVQQAYKRLCERSGRTRITR